ncbi:hypothetical protein MY4824_006076 [Beauveria thailandica]
MSSVLITIASLFALNSSINLASAAHAGFHVHFPWATRGPTLGTRPGLEPFSPFCGEPARNPQQYARSSRTFLSFSGHPGDLVTVLYTPHRVPRGRDEFQHSILMDVPIAPSGQLCVNITLQFQTRIGEMGVMYFEAKDPRTGNSEYQCLDVEMADLGIEALPEDHPAMCAANNETLIPMPDEYM